MPCGDIGQMIISKMTTFTLDWTGATHATLLWTGTGERIAVAVAAMVVTIFFIVREPFQLKIEVW
jgi:hypothetical protein